MFNSTISLKIYQIKKSQSVTVFKDTKNPSFKKWNLKVLFNYIAKFLFSLKIHVNKLNIIHYI